MPLVTRIVGIKAADVGGSCTRARRIIGDAEVQGFQTPASAIACDVFNIGHAERGFNQRLDAYFVV